MSLDKWVQWLKDSTPSQVFATFKNLAEELAHTLPPLPEDPIEAAVLVPIVLHPGNPTILLTQRTEHLLHHAGQVSFPGGRVDAIDSDIQACVLRETQEEIGLDPGSIELISHIGEWPTYSGYMITPFIGLLTPPLQLSPNPEEVAEIFEVPLTIAFDTNRFERVHKTFPIPHDYHQLMYDNKRIWGYTASLLLLLGSHFQQMLQDKFPPRSSK